MKDESQHDENAVNEPVQNENTITYPQVNAEEPLQEETPTLSSEPEGVAEEPKPASEEKPLEPDTPEEPETDEQHPAAPSVSALPPAHGGGKKSKKKLILIILAAVLLIGGGGAAYYFLVMNKDKAPAVSQAQPETKKEEAKKEEPTKTEEEQILEKFIKPTTGETWLPAPKKVADLKYLKNEYEDPIEYYEVGARNGKTIYISIMPGLGEYIQLFEKGPDGKVAAIIRPDGRAVYNEESEKFYPDIIASSVAIDKDTHYDSLTLPDKFDVGNSYYAEKPANIYLGEYIRPQKTNDPNTKITLIRQYGDSKLEKVEATYPDTKLTSIGYVLTFPTNTKISLGYEPLETNLEKYRFSIGESSIGKDSLSAVARGCGNRYGSVTRADTIKDSDLKEVGQSESGKKVYELIDAKHPVMVKAYEEFLDFYKTDPTDNYKKTVTREQFVRAHAVLLHKDKNGQWLVYARDEYRPIAGCAKPVVYLYPTKAQNVNVRVGADVKVSEPFYNPVFGWNAFAKPDGSLSVGGKPFESLFWEGPGWGEYPVVSKGVVVPRSEAPVTIRMHLVQQGLNDKEIADFMEYWEPELPNKPFIRLSWLSLDELNKLAPLNITPRPQTMIRVFLDFAGLEEYTALEPQSFSAPSRDGFTVVEWGGLAHKRLY